MTSDQSYKSPSRLTWTRLIENGLDYLVHEDYVQGTNGRIKRAYEALKENDQKSLLEAADTLASQMRTAGKFATWLESVFQTLHNQIQRPALLATLRELHDHGVTLVTTNYDDLLEQFCRIPSIGRSNRDELLEFKRGVLDGVLHIHGSYHEPTEIILDSTSYYQITKSDEIQNILETYLEYKTILFLGCGSGLEDPNFSALLDWAASKQNSVPNRHCLLLRDGDTLRSKLLVPITYGTNYDDLAPFLSMLLSPKGNLPGSKMTREERACLHTLWPNGIHYEDQKNQNRKRVENTCLWALRHKSYLQWRDISTSKLLWIYADPGCGKSVLSRAIVDDDLIEFKAKGGDVLYYFFKDTIDEQRSALRAIASLLFQLFVQRPSLLRFAVPIFEICGDAILDRMSDLWKIFTEAVTAPENANIICVLDALDECNEEQSGQLVNLIEEFYEQQGIASKVKFLVTSRPYLTIRRSFAPLLRTGFTIALDGNHESDNIKNEIDLVIKHQSQAFSVQKIVPPEVSAFLEKSLLSMQQRTYLWLRLIWKLIQESFPDDVEQMTELINELPEGVTKTYEKLLQRCPNQSFARKVLGLVLVSAQPLTLDEIDIAIHIDSKSTSVASLQLIGSTRLRDTLPARCGHMISIVDSKIYFIHQTVKEFLVCKGTGIFPTRWEHSVNPVEYHQLMANICMRRILFEDVDRTRFNVHNALVPLDVRSTKDGDSEFSSYLVDCSFLFYAATYWADHCRAGGSDDSLLRMIIAADSETRNTFGDDLGKTLQVAALGGHETVLRLLFEKGAEVDARGGKYGTALQAASWGGREPVVRLLIENGAEVNAKGGQYGNALQAACVSGHEPVARLLIEKGADVNIEGGQYSNALQAASYEGHEPMVKLLLERGANVNIGGGKYDTALQAASWRGHESVVRLLIDRGAQVNAQGPQYVNALQVASVGGHEQIVRLLLDWDGVQADSKDKFGRTPVSWAASSGHEKVVRLLLMQNDVDFNSTDDYGRTPLMWALHNGRESVVTLFTSQIGPNTDSGYASAIDKKPRTVEEIQETRTIYSDASSTSTSDREHHISELAEDIFTKLGSEQRTSQVSEEVVGMFPELLKDFALKIGSTMRSPISLEVMVFVHKYSR